MSYRVILEKRGGQQQILGEFPTRKAAMTSIDQYRLDDEGHDEYWRLMIRDGDRVIYIHRSTNHIVDNLNEAQRKAGRILVSEE